MKKSSRFGRGSGAKSVGGSKMNLGNKDFTKQLMVERKETQAKIKKAIERSDLKFDKKV